MKKPTEKRMWQRGLGLLIFFAVLATVLVSNHQRLVPLFDRGDALREIASVPSPITAKAADGFSIEQEPALPTVTVTPQETRSGFSIWVESVVQWFRDLFRAKKPVVPVVTGCDSKSAEIPLENVACLEKRRTELNQSNRTARGDAELFSRMMSFVKAVNANGSTSGVKPSVEQAKILDMWRAASENPKFTDDVYWRDQKYFYRYAVHLAEGGLIAPRSLTSPADFLSVLNAALTSQKNVGKAELFSERTVISLRSDAEPDVALGKNLVRRPLVFQAEAGALKSTIGFLLENSGAPLAFVYNRSGLDYEKIPDVAMQSKRVVADFPGPMHADGPRLIELGVRNGNVFNFLTGGGARRSGLVVLTPDGRAYPFHVQMIDPSVWGSKSNRGTLDLSRSYDDLISFLTIAKEEKLSVFMEMLLAEESESNPGLTPIKNFASARGRRLLVWKKQTDAAPSLLVVNRDMSINHAVWAAHKLGFRWAVNLDCDFIDGARMNAGPQNAPLTWGTPLEGDLRNPYSRLLFFDEVSPRP